MPDKHLGTSIKIQNEMQHLGFSIAEYVSTTGLQSDQVPTTW